MIQRDIHFPNNHHAVLVDVGQDDDAQAALDALGIRQPEALIMIAGGAAGLDEILAQHPEKRSRLVRLLDHAFVPFVAEARALVIDGGTDVGVMALVSRALAGRGTTLLGVAPSEAVSYPGGAPHEGEQVPLEANHSHFVTVSDRRWGEETETMYRLADVITARRLIKVDGAESSGVLRRGHTPALCLVINGGDIAKQEVLCSVRRGWPVVLVEGSGGLADELARLSADSAIEDPTLAEIVVDGRLHRIRLDDEPSSVHELFARLLDPEGHEALLIHAWQTFARYDEQAGRHQRVFGQLQLLILILGLVAVSVALLHTHLESEAIGHDWRSVLRGLIIALPVALSIVMTVASRFKQGSKWVFMRAAAEAVKREIYLFRSHAGAYHENDPRGRDSKLADRLAAISNRAMTTVASESALPPYSGPIPPPHHSADGQDDGIRDLDANGYIRFRLGDQLAYYTAKTAKLELQLKRLSWLIYLLGGAGTLFAAFGGELWVALTTATAGAVTTHLEYQQTEFNLVKYNRARSELENIRAWWQGLPASEHTTDKFRLLVTHTEQVLESEFGGWMQNMQDSLEALSQRQSGSESKSASS